MINEIISLFTMAFFWSTLLVGFFIIKGGFEKKYLFTDNFVLAVLVGVASSLVKSHLGISTVLIFAILMPSLTFILFILLLLYRFFRNPNRNISKNINNVLSPADGRIIYIKELDKSSFPVSVKKKNMIKLEEITKTDILQTPCYLVGIAMTLFDVHINRSPVDGNVILVQHTDGDALGLRSPESTFVNERNTIVIKGQDNMLYGVIQIAARGVRRCITSVKNTDIVEQGQVIGKIRFGSQVDLILPRCYVIQVREGDQVHAGLSVIASKE